MYLCEHFGLPEVAAYWEQVVQMNAHQRTRFVSNMIAKMFNTIVGKRIALFGFAFKADTGDTRETPALYVTRELVEERANVVITDPKALENAKRDLADLPQEYISFEPDPYEAAKGAHAIAVMTEWKQYKELDFQRIYDAMEKPAFLFDGRNILDVDKLYGIGFNIYPIGRPGKSHL